MTTPATTAPLHPLERNQHLYKLRVTLAEAQLYAANNLYHASQRSGEAAARQRMNARHHAQRVKQLIQQINAEESAMRSMFIPPLGTTFELAEDWKFELYSEHRNSAFFKYLEIEMPMWTAENRKPHVPVMLSAGIRLVVDRIYIRRGLKTFDSVTFRMSHDISGKKVRTKRFWAKLEDVNRIKMKD